MALQFFESSNFENFTTPNLKVLGQNDIWVTHMANHIEYCKGEGGGFCQG
jgi:hypothetical protein